MRREVRRVGEVSEMGFVLGEGWGGGLRSEIREAPTFTPTTRCAKRMEPRSDSNEVAKRLVQRRGR